MNRCSCAIILNANLVPSIGSKVPWVIMGCKMEVVFNTNGHSTWTVNLSEDQSNIFYQSSLLFSQYIVFKNHFYVHVYDRKLFCQRCFTVFSKLNLSCFGVYHSLANIVLSIYGFPGKILLNDPIASSATRL